MPELDHSGRRQFGRYQLLYRFASGGMGDVYLGRVNGEEGFERLVAVKVIHDRLTDEPEFVKMFIDEARLASRISHPNVALTLDLGRVGKTHFIAMEYVDGESLVQLLRRVRPPMTYCARIVAEAAAGLHAAHELRGPDGQMLNVVHRDVSPHNILLSYGGTVKVVDFGVARARGRLQTTNGTVKGKFCYMSPEQLHSPKIVDRRADVFALGIVLYEMTTWQRLFKGESEGEQVNKVMECKIQPPSQVVADYPAPLEKIVLKALQRNPNDRFATAQELQEQLEQYILSQGEPVLTSSIGKMMSEVFADRIVEKREILNCAGQLPEVMPDAAQSSGSSLVLGSVASLLTARRGRLTAMAVTGAAIGVGGVVLGFHLLADRPATGGSTPAATRPPATVTPDARAARQVTIAARALPASATLQLAGEAMSNPFVIHRRASAGEIELLVTAPGHVTQRRSVSLEKGGSWDVKLDREPTGGEPKVAKLAPGKRVGKKAVKKQSASLQPKTKKTKGGVADEDVLSNPYK